MIGVNGGQDGIPIAQFSNLHTGPVAIIQDLKFKFPDGVRITPHPSSVEIVCQILKSIIKYIAHNISTYFEYYHIAGMAMQCQSTARTVNPPDGCKPIYVLKNGPGATKRESKNYGGSQCQGDYGIIYHINSSLISWPAGHVGCVLACTYPHRLASWSG